MIFLTPEIGLIELELELELELAKLELTGRVLVAISNQQVCSN
jgi:hypothetical protein